MTMMGRGGCKIVILWTFSGAYSVLVCCFASQVASYTINNQDQENGNNQLKHPLENRIKRFRKKMQFRWSDRAWVRNYIGLIIRLEAQKCV